MSYLSTVLSLLSNLKNIKNTIKNVDKLIVVVVIIFVGAFGYLYINHKLNKKDEKIQQQKTEIQNLKVINKKLKSDIKVKKFENNQSIKKIILKKKIDIIDVKNNHLTPDDTMITDKNKTVKKVKIKTIKDTTKLNNLEKGKEYIIELP